jgi:hypothetical protein
MTCFVKYKIVIELRARSKISVCGAATLKFLKGIENFMHVLFTNINEQISFYQPSCPNLMRLHVLRQIFKIFSVCPKERKPPPNPALPFQSARPPPHVIRTLLISYNVVPVGG